MDNSVLSWFLWNSVFNRIATLLCDKILISVCEHVMFYIAIDARVIQMNTYTIVVSINGDTSNKYPDHIYISKKIGNLSQHITNPTIRLVRPAIADQPSHPYLR